MFRFIHAADLHLDSPLRGLNRYSGAPTERLRAASREAFHRLVDMAINSRIDFLVLAGDLYDGDWIDFQSGLYLRSELARLIKSGISSYIVKGNHDARSVISRELPLPEGVHEFDSRKAQTLLHPSLPVAIHGRSFADRAMAEDLVPSYPAPRPGLFNIGVLHTSLAGDANHDTYAPTTVQALRQHGYQYWALGHIHQHARVSDDPWIVYPGNLQGRHARETGPKGCELVTVTDDFSVSSDFVELDVVRWTVVNVELTSRSDAAHADQGLTGDDLRDDLTVARNRIRDALEATIASAPDRLHAVRLHLEGQTTLAIEEARMPGTLAATARAAAQDVNNGEVWVERVELALRAPFDRAAEARRDDAVGELVRAIDRSAGDSTELDRLLAPLIETLIDKSIPSGLLTEAERAAFRDPSFWRELLLEAEDTLLARLGNEVKA
ncbi:metallophosphoesterase family protein [Derxia gummosa]|uniref:Metallophosphoesterase family protein n=1 Tax=Derxia gummosa DSM 723 TaxID=1121388 RepID=A0A8B6X7K4_9BURK|nr:DNA repair exonuclease [Derxia gummosa]